MRKLYAILVLLGLASMVQASYTSRIERVVIPYVGEGELDDYVLPAGFLTYAQGDPQNVRIGDGKTPGGLRICDPAGLTNTQYQYYKDVHYNGNALWLNEETAMQAYEGILRIRQAGETILTLYAPTNNLLGSIDRSEYWSDGTNEYLRLWLNVASVTERPIIEYMPGAPTGTWVTATNAVYTWPPANDPMEILLPIPAEDNNGWYSVTYPAQDGKAMSINCPLFVPEIRANTLLLGGSEFSLEQWTQATNDLWGAIMGLAATTSGVSSLGASNIAANVLAASLTNASGGSAASKDYATSNAAVIATNAAQSVLAVSLGDTSSNSAASKQYVLDGTGQAATNAAQDVLSASLSDSSTNSAARKQFVLDNIASGSSNIALSVLNLSISATETNTAADKQYVMDTAGVIATNSARSELTASFSATGTNTAASKQYVIDTSGASATSAAQAVLSASLNDWSTLSAASKDYVLSHAGYGVDDETIVTNNQTGVTLSGTFSGTHTGSGSGLTSLPATVITNNKTGITLSGTFSGTHTGSGAGLTSLPSSVVTNTQSGISLSGTFSGTHTGSGSGLTSLPSSVVTNNQTGVTLSGTFSGTHAGSGSGLTNISINRQSSYFVFNDSNPASNWIYSGIYAPAQSLSATTAYTINRNVFQSGLIALEANSAMYISGYGALNSSFIAYDHNQSSASGLFLQNSSPNESSAAVTLCRVIVCFQNHAFPTRVIINNETNDLSSVTATNYMFTKEYVAGESPVSVIAYFHTDSYASPDTSIVSITVLRIHSSVIIDGPLYIRNPYTNDPGTLGAVWVSNGFLRVSGY